MKHIITIIAFFICFTLTAFAEGWTQTDNVWYYYNADGSKLTNSITPDGYYVDANGAWTTNPTFVNRVLYEDSNVKITGLSFVEEKPYKYANETELRIWINVQNKSTEDWCVQVRKESVNGMACDATFSCEIPAGKATNDNISWDNYSLNPQGLTPTMANTVEFNFHIFNWENWDSNYDTKTIIITK